MSLITSGAGAGVAGTRTTSQTAHPARSAMARPTTMRVRFSNVIGSYGDARDSSRISGRPHEGSPPPLRRLLAVTTHLIAAGNMRRRRPSLDRYNLARPSDDRR